MPWLNSQITSSTLSPPMPRLTVYIPKQRSQTSTYLRRPFVIESPNINIDGFRYFIRSCVIVMGLNSTNLAKLSSIDCPGYHRWILKVRVIYVSFERYYLLLTARGFPHVSSLLKNELKFEEHNSNGFLWKNMDIKRDLNCKTVSSLAETIALIRINETVIFSKENGKEMLALQTSYVSSPPATKCLAGETWKFLHYCQVTLEAVICRIFWE